MKSKGTILIVGGGKTGQFLARSLTQKTYKVNILDLDQTKTRKIADEIGIIAYIGDGTEVECLRASGASEADYVIAATGKDELNLVICQLAKNIFSTRMTVALVSDPENEELFSRLGVDETICASSIVAGVIERVLPVQGMRLLSEIGKSTAEIYDFSLQPGAPSVGAAVSTLRLPSECVLIAVTRGDDIVFPRGETVLKEGDHVYGLSKADKLPAMSKALIGV